MNYGNTVQWRVYSIVHSSTLLPDKYLRANVIYKGPYWVVSAEEEFVDQINQPRHTQHDIVDLDLSLVVVFHLQQLV